MSHPEKAVKYEEEEDILEERCVTPMAERLNGAFGWPGSSIQQ